MGISSIQQDNKMTRLIKIPTIGFLLLAALHTNAEDNLQKCWNNQVKPLKEQYFTFSYQEKLNELEHSFEPWQQTNYVGNGTIWINAGIFLKNDTLTNPGRKSLYYSKTQFSNTELLFLDYGEEKLSTVTHGMFSGQPFKVVRYSPVMLIDYFFQKRIAPDKESNNTLIVYKTIINRTIVTLYITKSTNLVAKITTLDDNELFGDVLTTFIYSNYSNSNKVLYPKSVRIEKINGQVIDEVKISNVRLISEVPKLIDKPIDYKIADDTEERPEIKVEKYSDNIHFIELKHTDDKVMIVEFSNFLLVAEAPLNSKNGELIISEAKKIAPSKPIKYFVFGHYHPHYLGGMRPFVHKGAKIVCSKINQEYVSYLANADHTLNPDSLQLQPKPLLLEVIKDSLVISDEKFEMKIFFIGKKSGHTNDYLIYYFPVEKLLFQDDLVWIAKEGEIKKASGRQAGLYHAIKELGLNVETIVQSWPVSDYGVKTVIPFADLEKSMLMK